MKAERARAWLVGCLLGSVGAFAARADGPPDVLVCRPASLEITEHQDFIGRIEAAAEVEIRPRVTSIVEKVLFKEGSLVRRGDLLFQLDSRAFQVKLDKARAEVQLAEAGAARADAYLRRLLSPKGHSAGAEVEISLGEARDANARTAIARAGQVLAELELEATRISSPMDGRVGAAKVGPGALVLADGGELAKIVSLEPMYAEWSIDERTLLRQLRSAHDGTAKAGEASVEIGLIDDEGHPMRGAVDFLDNHVDRSTGIVRARSRLPNPSGLLMPGMSARVRMQSGGVHTALAVPESAVGSKNGRRFAMFVNGANIVEPRPVVLGELYNGMRVLKSGATPNDMVAINAAEAVNIHGVVNPIVHANPAGKKTGPVR